MKIFIIIATILTSMIGHAKDYDLMLEIDPLTFVQDGYSLHLRYKKNSLVYGVGTYSLEMPKILAELNDKNKGFNQKIDQGYVLFLDYIFDNEIKGLTVGIDITAQAHTVTFNEGSTSFDTIIYLPRVGYHFEPFDNKIYFFPWAGIGYTKITSGNANIASKNKNFDFQNVTGFVTLHIGYKF